MSNPENVTLNRLGRWLVGASGYRIMYDDYSGNTIPSSAQMVAGYEWWNASQWARFQGKPALLIVTRADHDRGDVLDCEVGDATPGQCAGWIARRKAAGYHRPTIYCNRSTMGAVRLGTGRFRLGVDYDLWIAEWTGHPHEVPGAAATQYANVGTLYDLSSVYDSGWPHRKAGGGPTPPPRKKAKGPYKQRASGTLSLHQVATLRNTTIHDLCDLIEQHGTLKQREAFLHYVIKGGTDVVMPKGLVFYTRHHGGHH